MKKWSFPSSSSSATYTAFVAEDGKLLCDCRGWTFKHGDNPRQCKHTKSIIRELSAGTEVRGEFVFVASGNAPKSAAKIEVAISASTVPKPMLASAMLDAVTGADFDTRFDVSEWAMEEKLDGHRCTAIVSAANGVTAYSRPRAGGQALASELPERIIEQLANLPDGIYDGEKVAVGGKSWNVTEGGSTLVFIIFDVLEILGVDVTRQSYDERRELLLRALARLPEDQTAVSTIQSVTPSWIAVEAIWRRNGEGSVLKRRSSKYQSGQRSADWIKVKKIAAAKLTIIGFTAGKSGPFSTIDLRDAEGNETRVKTLNNAILRSIAADPDAYVGRDLVISFQERTPAGGYRHPMFDHFAFSAADIRRTA